jgi:hypothetical protein
VGDRINAVAAQGMTPEQSAGTKPEGLNIIITTRMIPKIRKLLFGTLMLVPAAELKAYLDARVADKRPSVIVFLHGEPPAEALPSLRRYLDAGGKLVVTGITRGLWPPDATVGRRTIKSLDFVAPGRLLGVDHTRAIFDPRGARATPAGERWGLAGNWRSAWSVAPEAVSEVLARDEWGLAAAWAKSFGGDPGTGLVRVPDHDGHLVYLAAEYRPR